MALATFNPSPAPSPGTSNKPELKLIKADFGDGYTQYAADGLNHIRKVLSLTWDVLLPAEAKVITDFLEAQGGYIPFYYTPSDEATPIKWTCEDWSDQRNDAGFRKITATLRQSFNLIT